VVAVWAKGRYVIFGLPRRRRERLGRSRLGSKAGQSSVAGVGETGAGRSAGCVGAGDDTLGVGITLCSGAGGATI
jgi:hypothetical protein